MSNSHIEIGKKEIITLAPPKKKITFAEWEDVIQKNLPNTLNGAKICLAVICQLLIKDIHNPFALVLVDVPSTAKTLTLNLFSNLNEIIHSTDKFTPASFVSHSASADKETLRGIDLLPKLKGKTFVLRDMATIFCDNPDRLQENIGILTRVLDGEGYKSESGVKGTRGYSGNYLFMMLAATTPISSKTWKQMSLVGARLFFYNTRQPEATTSELVSQLSSDLPERIKICSEATENLVRSIWGGLPKGIDWVPNKEEKVLNEMTAKAAILLSKSRAVARKELKNAKDFSMQVENPSRLNQLLYNFARGNAVSNNRNYLNRDDIKQAILVAVESAPPRRAQIIRHLLENNGVSDSSEIAKKLEVTKPTTLVAISELDRVGVVKTIPAKCQTEADTIQLDEQFGCFSDFFSTG